jgi:hypothetical protein
MKNKYGLIIFILIILLVISEAYLFFAKDSVVSFFSNQEDLASLTKPIKLSPSNNAIDDSVIRTDRFKALKNNINNFEFDKICQRPVAVVKAPVVETGGTEASSTPVVENVNCQQGNNNPFLITKKK